MRRKSFGMMLAALAILVGSAVHADDEQIANHLYKKFSAAKQQGTLKNFTLDMEVKEGVVFLTGRVASQKQKSMVLTMAQKAQPLGVVEIRDGISIGTAKRVPVSNAAMQRARQASANSPVQDYDYLSGPTVAPPAHVAGMPAGMPARTPVYRPVGNQVPMAANQQAPLQAPPYMPASSPAGNGARYDAPGLPNYAWPSYAPHPNYGAVTYPKTYSPTAWPYIGPFYPYPQVPLGWRKVTLEWDDGWWFLDFNDR